MNALANHARAATAPTPRKANANANVEAYHQSLQQHIQSVLKTIQQVRPNGVRTNSDSTNASKQTSDLSQSAMTRTDSAELTISDEPVVTPPDDLPPDLTARPTLAHERDEEHRRAWEQDGRTVVKRAPTFTLNLGALDVTKHRRKSDGQQPGMSTANADAVAMRMGLAPIRPSPSHLPKARASAPPVDETYESRQKARLARKRRDLAVRVSAWSENVEQASEEDILPITPTPPSPSVQLRHHDFLSLHGSPGGTMHMPSARSRAGSSTSGSSTGRAYSLAPASSHEDTMSSAPHRRASSTGPAVPTLPFPSQPIAVTFTGNRGRNDKLYLIPPTPDEQPQADLCERLRAILGPRDARGSATSLPALADLAPARPPLDRDATITNRNKRRSMGE